MKHPLSRKLFIQNSAILGFGSLLPNLAFSSPFSIDTKAKIILFQGDSITDGNRGRDNDLNHIMGHGYAFSIASRMGADFPKDGFVFYNKGISGNTVSDLQHRWQEDAVNINPDILSILIGINDVHAEVANKPKSNNLNAFEANYRNLLDQSLQRNPHILFVLGLPFVYPSDKTKNHWSQWEQGTASRAATIQKIALEYNTVLINYPAVFEKAAETKAIEYWIWDGIHPTVAGHELMARAWIKAVSKRLPILRYYHY